MKATDLTAGCYVMVHPSNMVIKVAAVYRSQVGYMADGKIAHADIESIKTYSDGLVLNVNIE